MSSYLGQLRMSAEEVGNVRSAGKDVSREPVGSNAKIVSEEFFHLHGYSFESAILNRFQLMCELLKSSRNA